MADTLTKPVAPAPIPSTPAPTARQTPTSGGATQFYPPGFGPPPTTPATSDAPVEVLSPSPLASPPQRDTSETPAALPERSDPAPLGSVNYYPPGFAGAGGTSAVASAPAKAPIPSSPTPTVRPVPSSPPPDAGWRAPTRSESPATEMPSDIAELLPPSSGHSETPALSSMAPRTVPLADQDQRRQSSVDELLPPGVESSAAASAAEAVPATVVEIDGKTPDGIVVLPSSDGGFVAVREAVKTVEFGGEEVELRRLTPEEKSRRRIFRTLFMAGIGLLFLTVVAAVLIMLNG